MTMTNLPKPVGATGPSRRRFKVPSALRSPSFRNYWLGMMASVTGYQMLVMFALGWLIYDITDEDARYVGYMTASIAAPAIVLNLFGGIVADKLNPKRLLTITQFVTALVVIGLGVLKVADIVNQWHVLVAAFLIGAVQAFDTPSRQSIFPRLIERGALTNAVALVSIVWTGTRIIAPTVAALIIGWAGIATAIFVSAAGFIILSLVSMTLKVPPIERAKGSVLKEMVAGFTFIKESPIFSYLIGMTFFSSMFGMSYIFLMPVFASKVLEVGPEKIGLLIGASGAGAFVGIIISANLGKRQRNARVLIGGAVLFGSSLVLFAIVSHLKLYEVSLAVLFLEGMFNALYLMAVMTTLQALVPDKFRGRVMGFYAITWSLAPLGGLQSNFVAYYINAPVAVALSGSLVVAFALGVAMVSRSVRSLVASTTVNQSNATAAA